MHAVVNFQIRSISQPIKSTLPPLNDHLAVLSSSAFNSSASDVEICTQLEVSPRVRDAMEAGEMLRQHSHHQVPAR